MSMQAHFAGLEPTDLVEIYRHWAGEIGVPTGDEALVRAELARLMTDRDRVAQRYRELPARCRDFIGWLVHQEGYTVPVSRLDRSDGEIPVPSFEADAVAFALKKRGFLVESRDRSWMHYGEPVYRIPTELGEVLTALLGEATRSVESQLSLRALLRTLPRAELARRLGRLGLPAGLAEDKSALQEELARPEVLDRALASLEDRKLRDAATRVLLDHGGVADARHMERLGLAAVATPAARAALEAALVGTVLDGDLTDAGLQLGTGGLVVFLEPANGHLRARLEAGVDEEPAAPADILAEIAAVRTFLDHHSVRVTRDGTIYRATQRKMEAEVLSPGVRPVDGGEAVTFLLRFLEDAGLVQPDRDGRLRTTASWKTFDARGPIERAQLVLTHVVNDVRGARGPLHQPRLRRLLLGMLRDFGPGRWLALRPLVMIARNRYLLDLDVRATAERIHKRYKYASLPALVGPNALANDLFDFAATGLGLAGLVDVHRVEEQPVAVRLTRFGAGVLGLPVDIEDKDAEEGALIVTADFEVVILPGGSGPDAVHAVRRFARREKADYSLHYRITQRSVQEGVAGGQDAEDMLAVLRRHGRHPVPANVETSIRLWASEVRILSASRTLLLRAPSKEILEDALRLREIQAIAVERLNDTTLEVREDPASARIAEVLRAQGFFLR